MESRDTQEKFPVCGLSRSVGRSSGQCEPDLPGARGCRVLIGCPDSLVIRGIRLSLEGTGHILRDMLPAAQRTFERAMQYGHDLFILALQFKDIFGGLLHDPLGKACGLGEAERVAAPGVLLACEQQWTSPGSLRAGHRIRGPLGWPFGMDELLGSIDSIMPGMAMSRAIRALS